MKRIIAAVLAVTAGVQSANAQTYVVGSRSGAMEVACHGPCYCPTTDSTTDEFQTDWSCVWNDPPDSYIASASCDSGGQSAILHSIDFHMDVNASGYLSDPSFSDGSCEVYEDWTLFVPVDSAFEIRGNLTWSDTNIPNNGEFGLFRCGLFLAGTSLPSGGCCPTIVAPGFTLTNGGHDLHIGYHTPNAFNDFMAIGALQAGNYRFFANTLADGVAQNPGPIAGTSILNVRLTIGPLCAADIAGNNWGEDGTVNVDDLLAVINAWGARGGPADLNHDNIVNVDDLLGMINNWGPCP